MDINQLLFDLLRAILIATIPVLTAYIIKFLNAKFDQVKVATEDSALKSSINDILDTILEVVSSVSQTYVDSLKSSGKFDAEAQKQAFNKAKETILSLLSEEAKELIVTLYNDLDTWLDVQIENAVRNSKLQ